MRRGFCSGLCAAAAFAALVSPATAQSTGVVTFNGLVLPSCVLTLGTPGLLAAGADGHELSSDRAGGVSGMASLLSTGAGYKLQMDAPSSFRLAPAGGQAESITTRYEASGATVAASTNVGAPLSLGIGLTNLDVDMTARKDTGIFPAGAYAADVLVRCVA